jgi:Peptidase_C39 like family
MKLPLDQNVLVNHIQKYRRSCVPMSVELVLKLIGKAELSYYDLQDEKGDVPRWGGDYDSKIYCGIKFCLEFDIQRGLSFPLDRLFDRIKEEIGAGRYVITAWETGKDNNFTTYHNYVIYGYDGNEFLAVTRYYNNPTIDWVSDMKSRIIGIQGSDILTYTIQ